MSLSVCVCASISFVEYTLQMCMYVCIHVYIYNII